MPTDYTYAPERMSGLTDFESDHGDQEGLSDELRAGNEDGCCSAELLTNVTAFYGCNGLGTARRTFCHASEWSNFGP